MTAIASPPLDSDTASRLLQVIGEEDWNDPRFSERKAWVGCVLSQLAYEFVPDDEVITQNDEMLTTSIVPSLRYVALANATIETGIGVNPNTGLEGVEFPEVFTLVSRYATAVYVKFDGVIIVAFRGTRFLYATDWAKDLNILWSHHPFFNGIALHKGFKIAALKLFNQLSKNINRLTNGNNDIPVYLTGHSLGGSIAGILHDTWDGGDYLEHFWDIPLGNGSLQSKAAYTFGMPRYTNRIGINAMRRPFLTANFGDAIIDLPRLLFKRWKVTKWLDSPRSPRSSSLFNRLLYTFRGLRKFHNHEVEVYRERLSTSLGFPFIPMS